MADPRLIPNRQTALTRYINKYGTGSNSFASGSFAPSTVAGIKALDAQRANLGQNPFTNLETTLGARATDTGQAQVPEPDGNFFEDVARNVQSIVSEVPKLPVTLVREVGQLGSVPEQIAPALTRGTNPLEDLGNLAQLPGLRMIPGSFIASQFGTDQPGVSGLVNNPVFTALDVLPYASKAAKLSGTVAKATELADQARPILAQTGIPTRTPPIRTFIENWKPGGPEVGTAKLGVSNLEYPALQPNAVGRAVNNITDSLKSSTAPGRWANKTFGQDARMLAISQNRFVSDASLGSFMDDAPVDHELAPLAADLRNQAFELAKEFKDIPEAAQARIARTIEVGKPGAWQKLEAIHPQALEYASRYKSLNDTWGEALAGRDPNLRILDVAGGPEIYDARTATVIEKARHGRDVQAAVGNLRSHLDSSIDYTMPVDQILADAQRAMKDPMLSVKRKVTVSKLYTQALENAGVDVAALRKIGGKPNAANLQTMFDNVAFDPERLLGVNKPRVTAAAQELQRLARTDPTIADFRRSIMREDWTRARDMAKMLEARKKFTIDPAVVDLPEVRFELQRLHKSNIALRRAEAAGFTDSAMNTTSKRANLVEKLAAPARFQPAVLDTLSSNLQGYLRDTQTPGPALDSLIERAANQVFDDPTLVAAIPELKAFKAEARRSWQELKAQGYDPTFVHHTPNGTQALPKVVDWTPSLSQVKARLWDASPSTTNLALTLNGRAMEYLSQQGSRAFADWFTKTYTRTEAQLFEEFYGAAADNVRANPGKTFQAHRRNLIEKEWAPFDPNSFMNPGHSRIGANPETTLYAPRGMVEVLEKLQPKPSELGALMEKPMQLFRTSLLPLSPRWHVYNIIGGAIMMLGRAENPLTVWKYVNEARKMVKEGGIEGRLSQLDDLTTAERAATRTAVPVVGREQGEFFRNIDTTTDYGRFKILSEHAAGKTIRRLWDSATTKKVMRDPFNTVVSKSYSFNEWFDDFYKSMAYLEGSDKALVKGMSREQQILKGIEASRQILQNWDSITPMERTAMRFLMPFYGWTRTLLRYTLTYPADHPWRTSILANMARAEMTDQQSGLPQRLRDLLFIGDRDAEGNQTAINLSGMNPFRDISSYFTLAGFLGTGEGDIGVLTSQLNPIISTTLQWAGVDPSSGSPELYPDMRYDPTTGQLVVAPRENPSLGLIGNFVPQSRLFMQMTGMSKQFRELAARNPAAAGRMMASSAGFPVLQRQVNVPQEVTKAEAQRLKFLRTQLNEALKRGDRRGFVSAYPKLGGLYDTMAQKLAEEGTATPDSSVKGGGQSGVGAAIGSMAEALKTVVPGL